MAEVLDPGYQTSHIGSSHSARRPKRRRRWQVKYALSFDSPVISSAFPPSAAGRSILHRENEMADGREQFATLGHSVRWRFWGEIARDIQEALFETAMGVNRVRQEFASSRTVHLAKPA
ncbi:hypothetical protein [Bradyrhizobium sp. AZCC 1578]|uniref:hypothetical protein n=2 Tax=unclassified Bradyrhizobium TaxID=2631580 RepID=UPI002FEF4BC6